MSSENRKQHQRRCQPVNVVFAFWRSPTGWVIGGIAISIVLAAGVSFYYGHIRDRVDVLTAQPPAGAQITVVVRGGTPEADNSLGAEEDGTNTPRPPSSFDPAARLPEPEAWLKNAVAAAIPDGRPMIAVVIDDVGLDRHRSRRAMALPAPVTIALMAYAGDARDQAETARTAGHKLIVHLPMEPYEECEPRTERAAERFIGNGIHPPAGLEPVAILRLYRYQQSYGQSAHQRPGSAGTGNGGVEAPWLVVSRQPHQSTYPESGGGPPVRRSCG